MEEFYAEGLATHGGPESCVDDPQGRGEALTPGKARHGGDRPGRSQRVTSRRKELVDLCPVRRRPPSAGSREPGAGSRK